MSHTGLRLDHQRYMDPYRRRWIDYRREYTNGPYVACNCYRGGPVAAEVPCPKLVSRIRSLVERRIVRLTESFHGFHHCDSFYTNFRLARPNSCYECMFGGFFRGARLDGSLLWNENQFLSPVPLFDFDYSRNSFSLNGIYPANMGELRRVYREEHSSLEEIIGHENSWGVPMNGNLNLYPVHPDYFYNRVRRIPALNLQMGGSIPMVPQSPIPAVVSAETTTRESTTLESIYY